MVRARAEKWRQCTYAYLMCLIPSSSGSTQFCQSGEPYDMHPKMIFETFSPEFPRRTMMTRLRFIPAKRSRSGAIQRTVLHFGCHNR